MIINLISDLLAWKDFFCHWNNTHTCWNIWNWKVKGIKRTYNSIVYWIVLFMNWWNARKNWRQFIWRSWIFQVGHVVEEVKVSYVVEMGVKSIANVCLLVLWVAMEPFRVLVAVGLWWSVVLLRLKLWYSACAGLFWCCCYCCIYDNISFLFW